MFLFVIYISSARSNDQYLVEVYLGEMPFSKTYSDKSDSMVYRYNVPSFLASLYSSCMVEDDGLPTCAICLDPLKKDKKIYI
ncbi:hypothetical protein CI610_01419 [invertebrate metagenome]|uniref:Uncharacterized protein n=1 Tax=invertebrate metagenome TaxID=1711999 RepID=A0A2H9T8P0_9ZZZZ